MIDGVPLMIVCHSPRPLAGGINVVINPHFVANEHPRCPGMGLILPAGTVI